MTTDQITSARPDTLCLLTDQLRYLLLAERECWGQGEDGRAMAFNAAAQVLIDRLIGEDFPNWGAWQKAAASPLSEIPAI